MNGLTEVNEKFLISAEEGQGQHLNSNNMKIYIIKASQGTQERYFGTAYDNAEKALEILKKKNPGLNLELHKFDIIVLGKNSNKLFEEL